MAHFVSGGTDDPRTATKYAQNDYAVKLAKQLSVPPGACAVFSAVITRREKDRSGDVLESSGCILDEKLPLLLGHDHTKIIGRMEKKLTHNKDEVTAAFAIVDTELGRDAAKLAEFGALRLSHGFKVLEGEPWRDGSPGWHIKKFETVEVSLCAVPCLPTAALIEIQRVKSWSSSEGRKWVESLQQQSEFDRRFAASCAGKSSWELSMDDLYHRNGFQTPAERNTIVLSPAPAPAPASNPGVDRQAILKAILKAMQNVQGAMMYDYQEFKNAREALGKK